MKGPSAGTGVASTVIELGVYIYDEETELPREGAQFTVLNAPNGTVISAVTNADGLLNLKIVDYAPHATVMLQGEVTLDGYEPESGDIELTAGHFYSIDVPMKQAP